MNRDSTHGIRRNDEAEGPRTTVYKRETYSSSSEKEDRIGSDAVIKQDICSLEIQMTMIKRWR